MRKIPRNVVWLGIVSFLTDLSSEMVLPVILPLYMKTFVPPQAMGIIEGTAEAVASLLKLASGWLSDVLKKRKALVIAGYLTSSIMKPLFAIATSWWHFLIIRFMERTGKGIRTAPRDALLAASVSPENRGISFGFHRALDTAGAFMGLLTALLVVWLWKMEPKDFTILFYISFVPGILAVIVLAVAVREFAPPVPKMQKEKQSGPVVLNRPFIAYLVVTGVFTLGNSSDAFLVWRAKDLFTDAGHADHIANMLVLCLMLAMNAVDASLATWFGSLSDRLGRRNVLAFSFSIYALVYLGIAFATHAWMLWILFAVYGLYYGASHGAQTAFVADLIPDEARGRAYGLFHTIVGIMAFPASAIMGVLYKVFGPQAAFSFGAVLAVIAVVLLFTIVQRPKAITPAQPELNNVPGA